MQSTAERGLQMTAVMKDAASHCTLLDIPMNLVRLKGQNLTDFNSFIGMTFEDVAYIVEGSLLDRINRETANKKSEDAFTDIKPKLETAKAYFTTDGDKASYLL